MGKKKMKGFCPLASGSKGNCLYFGIGKTKILIDAGISAKAARRKLAELDVDLSEIQAILISHEHTDHIQGVNVIAKQCNIPILANVETAKGIYAHFGECPKFKIFLSGEKFIFGDIEIRSFSVPHDAADPVGFTITAEGVKMGICTDLGFASSLVQTQLQGCDYLYIEANHQPSMVHASSRPMIYKQRVLGRNGHLSNEDCGQLLSQLLHPGLKHVHLAHLSQECNTPATALDVVRNCLGDKGKELPISIAPQETIGKSLYFEHYEALH